MSNPSLKIRILCRLGFIIYRLLTLTYRIKFVHPERVTEAKHLHPAGSFVYGLWHENFFTAVATHPNQGIAPMISQSNDGELISFIAEKLGFKPVRGSTSRGGEAAREALYEQIQNGLQAAFTADGPKGPRRKMKSGLVDLSRSGHMAILPLAIDADRKWILEKSWDKSLIPKPFAHVYVVYGKPFIVPPEAKGAMFAEAKRYAQKSINAVADEAAVLAANGAIV
jgi:lysophospholipid acyltransferase (LPLAT)-like uncharacterized protein